jgi:N-acetylmuramoyl-L-alanine amidase
VALLLFDRLTALISVFMSFYKKTAKKAVVSVVLAIVFSGSAFATAFGDPNSSLLPQSVRDAAVVEEQSPANKAEAVPSSRDEIYGLERLVMSKSGESATDAEEKCLASAIFYEARSESFEGQLAVAQVILNRVASGRFARSICGVVLQPGQFSFVRGGVIPAIDKAGKDWREALGIARIAQAKLHRSDAQNALFFHATRVNPKWRLNRVASIGNHVFYR